MKNAKRFLLTVLAAGFAVVTVRAQAYLQDPRYGDTPEERQQNVLTLNYFNDAYAAKNYDAAATHLKTLLEKAPRASQNLYINGANIYKTKISRATSVEEKNRLVDTLMNIYDLRVEYYGDNAKRGKPYILGIKAQDYLAYRPTDREKIYQLFKDAIEAGGENTDPDIINGYFHTLTEDYQQDMVETDILLNEYDRLAALFDTNPNLEKEEGKKVLDALLISSGAANCENLEKLFKPQYAENPNDLELTTKIVGLLSRNNCNSDFQLEVTENYYRLNPSPETALALATVFEERKDYEKSLHYLREAMDKEEDVVAKSNYLARAASALLGSEQYRQAAELAKEAIGMNAENGVAYYVLAQAYAAGSSSACSDFARQTVFWLVVDNLNTANRLIQEAEYTEDINKLIGTYRAYFPTAEEAFFRTLNNGDGYTVNCGWINGRTTVRTR